MQVKGCSGNLGLLAQGGNGYLFIGYILEQFQKRILNHAFGYEGSSKSVEENWSRGYEGTRSLRERNIKNSIRSGRIFFTIIWIKRSYFLSLVWDV